MYRNNNDQINNIKQLIHILVTIPKLGYWNVAYMIWYKLSMKFGIRKRWFPIESRIKGDFFKGSDSIIEFPTTWAAQLLTRANEVLNGTYTFYSYHKYEMGSIPNWFYNPFNGKSIVEPNSHWTEISDFDAGIGDIKHIWELSRFDWLTTLARAHKVSGDSKYLERINQLLQDWSFKNPLNQGPNWKCGQEASIRVMKLITCAYLLDQIVQPTEQLKELVHQHLERIYPNIRYAIAQDNNHGTSEAAALYIGATWLLQFDPGSKRLGKWKRKGRSILEERILKLVQSQGNFSQRSMTYHRVMVDTMSFVLHMMDTFKEKPFGQEIVDRLTKLGEWQYKMTFGVNGDAPNYGSNDGALLENLNSLDYRDFRGSTQTFFGALLRRRVYDQEELSENLFWRYGKGALQWSLLKIELPDSEILDKQILILRTLSTQVMIKIPEATFRPGNDAFHVDLWYEGKNILRDSGTYSYNDSEYTDLLKSVRSHNTVQFGRHEQMPKISRFLNGMWLQPEKISNVQQKNVHFTTWSGSYIDYRNNRHNRSVILCTDYLEVIDKVFSEEMVEVNFHLIQDKVKPLRIEGYENYNHSTSSYSLYYGHKKESKVIYSNIVNKKPRSFKIYFNP